MFPRFALFAAALLASAALQARTPEVAVLDDHFRPTSCGGMLAMPASCSLPTDSLSFSKRLMVDRLQLEPLAPVSQPRHAINFTVGNEIGGIYGYFLALEYSAENYYRVKAIPHVLRFLGPNGLSPSYLTHLEVEWLRLLDNGGELLKPSRVEELPEGGVRIVEGVLRHFPASRIDYQPDFGVNRDIATRQILLSMLHENGLQGFEFFRNDYSIPNIEARSLSGSYLLGVEAFEFRALMAQYGHTVWYFMVAYPRSKPEGLLVAERFFKGILIDRQLTGEPAK